MQAILFQLDLKINTGRAVANQLSTYKATWVFWTPHAYWGYRIVRDLLVKSKKATSMTLEMVPI